MTKEPQERLQMDELRARKIALEKRSYTLRERLGIKTKLVHGQKVPKEIWQSEYYKELLEKKKELAEINKKLHGKGKKEQPLSERFTEMQRYRKALESIAKNTCCDSCQEAALVAQKALRLPEMTEGRK